MMYELRVFSSLGHVRPSSHHRIVKLFQINFSRERIIFGCNFYWNMISILIGNNEQGLFNTVIASNVLYVWNFHEKAMLQELDEWWVARLWKDNHYVASWISGIIIISLLFLLLNTKLVHSNVCIEKKQRKSGITK